MCTKNMLMDKVDVALESYWTSIVPMEMGSDTSGLSEVGRGYEKSRRLYS